MSELPKGWAETTIREVVTLRGEKASPVDSPDAPFIGLEDVESHTSRVIKYGRAGDLKSAAARFSAGEVLYSRLRPYLNKVILADIEGLASAEFLVLQPSQAIDADFIRRRITTDDFLAFTASLDRGDRPRVDFQQIGSFCITVPPIAEQRRIVAKLASLTGRTARARAELEHIPALITRYKQWILAAAFNGELTREWRAKHGVDADAPVVKLEQVAKDLSYGSSAKSSKQGEVPVLRMGNIQSGELDWKDLVYTSDPTEIKKYLLTPGDVLFNRTNSPELVGKTAVFRDRRKAIFAGYLIRVRCADNLLPEYLGFCLNSPQGRDYCWRVKTDGVSQSNINAKKLGAFSFQLPSIEEQREIVRRVQTALGWLDRVAAEREQAVRLLPRLDQAILAKAFRGELVPQSPDDEPASVLLERVRAARAEAPKRERKLRLRGTGGIEFLGTGSLTVVQKEQDMKTRKDVSSDHLSIIVKKSGGQIKADELWRASEMSIDEFYKLLRDDVAAKRLKESKDKASIINAN